MRISELIAKLRQIQKIEGDIEVERADGLLLREVRVISRTLGTANETPKSFTDPPEVKH